MKKLILIPCFFLIFTSCYIFSQSKYSVDSSYRFSYWNISFSAGLMFNAIDQINTEHDYYPGYNGSFEFFYTLEHAKSAIFLNFTYNKANVHSFENNYSYGSGFIEVKELLFGPRFYLGKGYFIEGSLGNIFAENIFNMTNKFDPYFYTGSIKNVYAGMCAAIGGGKTFELSHNSDFFIKGKISIGIPELKTILISSLNGGIIFNNRKIEHGKKKEFEKRNYWTISVLAGIVNPEFFHNTNYEISEKLGIEAALRKSTGIELFCNLNYNKINEKYSSSSNRNIIDLTFGPRFLFGNEKYMVLTEIGSGLYIYDINNDPYKDPDAFYIGANFGPGFIINVTEHVAFTAKSNLHFVFNNLKRPGGFLTASGGIRYAL